MSPTMQSLGLQRLSVEERLRLVQELWDSIAASDPEIPISDAQRAELDRRADELDRNPSIALSWDQVIEGIRDGR